MSYREYLSCVAGFAQELGPGVGGGRVALIMANSIDAAIATYGTLAAHAQVVPLNPAYTVHELRSILSDAAPSAVVCDAASLDVGGQLADELGIGRVIAVDASTRLTRWSAYGHRFNRSRSLIRWRSCNIPAGRPDAPRVSTSPTPRYRPTSRNARRCCHPERTRRSSSLRRCIIPTRSRWGFCWRPTVAARSRYCRATVPTTPCG